MTGPLAAHLAAQPRALDRRQRDVAASGFHLERLAA